MQLHLLDLVADIAEDTVARHAFDAIEIRAPGIGVRLRRRMTGGAVAGRVREIQLVARKDVPPAAVVGTVVHAEHDGIGRGRGVRVFAPLRQRGIGVAVGAVGRVMALEPLVAGHQDRGLPEHDGEFLQKGGCLGRDEGVAFVVTIRQRLEIDDKLAARGHRRPPVEVALFPRRHRNPRAVPARQDEAAGWVGPGADLRSLDAHQRPADGRARARDHEPRYRRVRPHGECQHQQQEKERPCDHCSNSGPDPQCGLKLYRQGQRAPLAGPEKDEGTGRNRDSRASREGQVISNTIPLAARATIGKSFRLGYRGARRRARMEGLCVLASPCGLWKSAA